MRKVDLTKNRPIILVDIDDTLNEFAETYWNLHNQLFEDNVHYSTVNQWDLGLFSKRGKEAYDLFKLPGLYRNIPLKPYAKKFMDSVQKMGEVFVVSDVPSGTPYGERFDFLDTQLDIPYSNPADDKRAWLKDNFPNLPKENVIFCSCKWMISGDILVDDKPDTYLAFHERGRDVILMDMPYNRHIETKWRAADLQEAEEMIFEMLTKKQRNKVILR